MMHAVALFSLLLLFGCGQAGEQEQRRSIHEIQHEKHKGETTVAEPVQVQVGLEVLFEETVEELRGKTVGIVINHTAVDRDSTHLVDRLLEYDDIELKAIFGPEHGYRGDEADGQQIRDGVDPVSGAKVYSLYGSNRKPSDEMMEGLEVLIYDIQDVGVRFYTYISTMGYAMQAAAEHGIPFWILDRPDPITGTKVAGPPRQEGYESFVGLYPIPVRYGMTPGELAKMIVGEEWMEFPEGFSPRVIRMDGWKRFLWHNETTAPWLAPSPNMPDLETATVYPGLCFIEGTNVSEGRGTESPFLQIGAPWIDKKELAQEMNNHNLPGVVFKPVSYTPRDIPGRSINSKYRGEQCNGVQIQVTTRNELRAVATGVYLIYTIHQLYPEDFSWRRSAIDRLYGSDQLRKSIDAGKTPQEIVEQWRAGLENFTSAREKYLLY